MRRLAGCTMPRADGRRPEQARYRCDAELCDLVHGAYYLIPPEPICCRVPINSILGFTIRTYRKVGFGRLRYRIEKSAVLSLIKLVFTQPLEFLQW